MKVPLRSAITCIVLLCRCRRTTTGKRNRHLKRWMVRIHWYQWLARRAHTNTLTYCGQYQIQVTIDTVTYPISLSKSTIRYKKLKIIREYCSTYTNTNILLNKNILNNNIYSFSQVMLFNLIGTMQTAH